MLLLVIDDDDLSRELLTLLLELEGYRVTSASSGEDGVSQIEKLDPKPDAILTDLQMPGLAGAELATALRAAAPKGTPLLAMSGSDSKPLGSDTHRPPKGFDGFLLKPFHASDLAAALAAAYRTLEVGHTVSIDAGLEMPQIAPAQEAPTASLPANPDAGALNEDVFLKMRELMPVAQLGELFLLCTADARKRIATMAQSDAAGDDDAYRHEAHAIKGGAGMIGAAELYTLAERAERDGLAGSRPTELPQEGNTNPGTTEVTALLDQFSRACERLERILVERLKT